MYYNKKLYCFQADNWKHCIGDNIVELTQIFRQADRHFVDILQAIRTGDPKPAALLYKPLTPDTLKTNHEHETETTIFPTNEQVDRHNFLKLQQLSEPTIIYACLDYVIPNWEDFYVNDRLPTQDDVEERTRQLEALLPTEANIQQQICVRLHAHVMLRFNISATLVNGSRGVIIGFRTWDSVLEELSMIGKRIFYFYFFVVFSWNVQSMMISNR